MFELPNAKRIRREDLLSRDSASPSSSPPPDSAYPDAQQRLGALLNFDSLLAPPQETPAPTSEQDTSKPENEDEEQEFEFRLFRAPVAQPPSGDAQPEKNTTAASEGGTQKLRIRLRSPTPGAGVPGEGRLVNPFRGWEYYFTTPELLSGEKNAGGDTENAGVLLKRKQFEDVAVSGEEMLGWAKIPWPGCHLPWRVIRLKREQTKLPRDAKDASTATTCIVEPPERIPTSRKKPGKKRRIQLRKRIAVAERAKETDAEKRNRKNREKKIKRRQKARELKAATAAAAITSTEGAAATRAIEPEQGPSDNESNDQAST